MVEIISNKSKGMIQISKHFLLYYGIWERKYDYRLAFKNIFIVGIYEHVFTGRTIGVLFHT
jgi:hypothetical protein